MKTGKSGFWSNLISAQVKFLKKWIHPKLGRIDWKETVISCVHSIIMFSIYLIEGHFEQG